MANVFVNEDSLSDIADAIRSKLGVQTTYKPSEMANAIESISGGGSTPTGTKEISITSNGTTTENVSAYASAEITVNVPNTYAAGDEGKVVSNGSLVAQTSDTVTTNDTYDTTLINSLTVNVSGETTLYPLDFPRKSKEITAFIYSYNEGTVKLQGTASENAIFVNLTDIIAGRTNASPHPINNYPKWFTLASGSHCVLTIKNVVNASNLSWNCNFRKANDTTSLDFGIGNGTHLNGETVTVDVSSSVDVGNLFVYVQSSFVSGNVLQFDIEFTVDGVRYF